jgi:hypothetical protein
MGGQELQGEETLASVTQEELEAAIQTLPRRRFKALTDNSNAAYLEYLSSERPAIDYITRNVKSVHTDGARPPRLEYEGEVYVYSGQRLQFAELQRAEMRRRFAADRGGHFTYSKDMLSGAFVLVQPADAAREGEAERRRKFLTERGFVWPWPKVRGGGGGREGEGVPNTLFIWFRLILFLRGLHPPADSSL